jgi:hypothetical protein
VIDGSGYDPKLQGRLEARPVRFGKQRIAFQRQLRVASDEFMAEAVAAVSAVIIVEAVAADGMRQSVKRRTRGEIENK